VGCLFSVTSRLSCDLSPTIKTPQADQVEFRFGAKEKTREKALRVAECLQRRYDLLFLHLTNPKPVRLTATLRWGISNSRIPAHALKLFVPTRLIEGYLADKLDPLFRWSLGTGYGRSTSSFPGATI